MKEEGMKKESRKEGRKGREGKKGGKKTFID